MSGSKQPRRAVVLAGAAAKGAFEAGALAVLAEHGVLFDSVVGTSAGALNATVLAAAIRAGYEKTATSEMVDFWVEQGRWQDFLEVSVRDIFALRGLSRSGRLEKLLLARLAPFASMAVRRNVQLRMIATMLAPDPSMPPPSSAARIFTFGPEDFAQRLPVIARAAVASAAFPGLFAPVHVPGVGRFADGGLVANTPLSDAVDEAAVDEVYVITPWPMDEHPRLEGVSLVSRWLEILIEERFHRQLERSLLRYQHLRAIEELRKRGMLSDLDDRSLRRALNLELSPVRVVVVWPTQPLSGNLLSAFGSRSLRLDYVASGRAAAELALKREATATKTEPLKSAET